MVMVLDLMQVHSFHCQVVRLVKTLSIFGAEMNSSRQIDTRKSDILILGDILTQGLDNATISAEAKFFVNIARSRKKLVEV